MRFLFLLLLLLPLPLLAQDRILLSGNQAYEGDFVDYNFGRLQLTVDSDSLPEYRFIPEQAILAWYTRKPGILSSIKLRNEALYAHGVDSLTAARWPVPPRAFRKMKLDTHSIWGILPIRKGEIVLEDSLVVPGLSRSQLQFRSLLWLAETFNHEPHALRLNSPEEGLVMGRGSVHLVLPNLASRYQAGAEFRIRIWLREGKAFIRYSGFTYTGDFPGNPYRNGSYWSRDIRSMSGEIPEAIMKRYLLDMRRELTLSIKAFKTSLQTDPQKW